MSGNTKMPMETSPLSKPSITTRDSVKSMGAVCDVYGGNGTEYKQASFALKGSGGGAKAASKGTNSIAPTPGTEYRQVSS